MPRLVGSDSGWRALAARHAWLLWWIHSLYALALGVVFMWLGARNFTWLRLAALHIVVIWGASLALANVIDRPGRDSIWWGRLRMVVNYVTKNFYQQILFFILPIYYASATAGSRNMAFVVLLAASAVMSTLDIVYDRHLSRRRELNALFFAFNLFAAVAVALPVLWSISNVAALRIASLGAVIGYVTIARQPTDLARPRTWKASAVGCLAMVT
jgi:heme/copper-type cytochrome/quinol oxidase subunit 4